MAGNQRRLQAAQLRKNLFDQGYLDDQFIQLEELQDDANPRFVEEIVKLYFSDSARLIRKLQSAMEESSLDFEKMENVMHQMKGSSSSIGEKESRKLAINFRSTAKLKMVKDARRHIKRWYKSMQPLKGSWRTTYR